jgi:hypothetical protein
MVKVTGLQTAINPIGANRINACRNGTVIDSRALFGDAVNVQGFGASGKISSKGAQ